MEEVKENAFIIWNKLIRNINIVEFLYMGKPGIFHKLLEEFDVKDDDTLIKKVFNINNIYYACIYAESRKIKEVMALSDKKIKNEFKSDNI